MGGFAHSLEQLQTTGTQEQSKLLNDVSRWWNKHTHCFGSLLSGESDWKGMPAQKKKRESTIRGVLSLINESE